MESDRKGAWTTGRGEERLTTEVRGVNKHSSIFTDISDEAGLAFADGICEYILFYFILFYFNLI
jgi:hypothetical protein